MAYTHYIPLLDYQCIVKSSKAIDCEIAVYTSYSAAIVCIRYKLQLFDYPITLQRQQQRNNTIELYSLPQLVIPTVRG